MVRRGRGAIGARRGRSRGANTRGRRRAIILEDEDDEAASSFGKDADGATVDQEANEIEEGRDDADDNGDEANDGGKDGEGDDAVGNNAGEDDGEDTEMKDVDKDDAVQDQDKDDAAQDAGKDDAIDGSYMDHDAGDESDDYDDYSSDEERLTNNPHEHLGRIVNRMAGDFKICALPSKASAVPYRRIDPVTADNHYVRLYMGPYDRYMRGAALIALWYGPQREAIRLAHRILTQWIGWPLLPPVEIFAAPKEPWTGPAALEETATTLAAPQEPSETLPPSQGPSESQAAPQEPPETLAAPLEPKTTHATPLYDIDPVFTPQLDCFSDVWTPNLRERLAPQVAAWKTRLSTQTSRSLSDAQAAPYKQPDQVLQVLVGPATRQSVLSFRPGYAYFLAQSGLPMEDEGKGDDDDAMDIDPNLGGEGPGGTAHDSSNTRNDGANYKGYTDKDTAATGPYPAGWMLDVGGVVTGMDWALCESRTTPQTQLLALAVSPFADQRCSDDYDAQLRQPDFQRHGTVQLWEFEAQKSPAGALRPARRAARRRRTLCLDFGRVTRVRWSPACHHLALLCSKGSVCVVAVQGKEADGAYEKIDEPLVTLRLVNETCVKPTSLAWSSFNRLVVGYSDGSIALWSLQPTRMLCRHAVHYSDVINLATGYPALPYLVASIPLSGSTKLIDVRHASYETTEVQANAVCLQPNLLAWSDQLLGFFTLLPSSNPLNTVVAFCQHRFFPMTRRVYTGESWPTCIAVGRTHPFLLVGAHDGALLCMNPQCELFRRRPYTQRLRVFQHEHRPGGGGRGAARVLQGFGAEVNRHAVAEVKGKGKAKAGDVVEDEDEAEAEAGENTDPKRGVVHEPGTRITTVEWNPNSGYGCWAAAAMASGLVRVLDLGLDGRDLVSGG